MAPDRDPMAEIEADLFGEATNTQKARRLLDNHVVMAAAQLVDLAQNGSSERIRLSAAESILNRVCGPAGKDDQQDSLVDFLQGIQTIANGSGNRSK
jgi:hypothetical protein